MGACAADGCFSTNARFAWFWISTSRAACGCSLVFWASQSTEAAEFPHVEVALLADAVFSNSLATAVMHCVSWSVAPEPGAHNANISFAVDIKHCASVSVNPELVVVGGCLSSSGGVRVTSEFFCGCPLNSPQSPAKAVSNGVPYNGVAFAGNAAFIRL